MFLPFWRHSNRISTSLTGGTLLKTPLTISVTLENNRSERIKRFRKSTLSSLFSWPIGEQLRVYVLKSGWEFSKDYKVICFLLFPIEAHIRIKKRRKEGRKEDQVVLFRIQTSTWSCGIWIRNVTCIARLTDVHFADNLSGVVRMWSCKSFFLSR